MADNDPAPRLGHVRKKMSERSQARRPSSSVPDMTQRTIAIEFVHFVLLRAVCAIFSYGLYILLLHWMRYEAAYVVAFMAGIGLAYVVSALFVFRQPMRRRSAFRFPIVYLLQFVLCLVLLRVAVETLGVPEWLALAFAVGVTLPFTFLLSRWIVRAG